MRLDGPQRRQLHEAILDAFSKSDLAALVSFEFNQNLDTIAAGSNLSEIVLSLIEYTENRGITRKLIETVMAERPSSQSIQALSHLLDEPQPTSPQLSDPTPSTTTLVNVNEVNPDSGQFDSFSSQLPTPSQPPMPPQEPKLEKRPLKVFISYAHKDEAFKDELVVMLVSMQRQGIIDAWQDRRIEPGDEWYQAIQKAMNECDLALLLVSKYFLASRFINDEEVPKLLQRRKEVGMRVIPIIISPCMWSSEPVLKDLQALPRDGKAVITFSEETGERDQAWTDIAKAIEKFAKELQSDVA